VVEEQFQETLELAGSSTPQRITSCRFWMRTAWRESSKTMLSCG
jgi:hypothetical protein